MPLDAQPTTSPTNPQPEGTPPPVATDGMRTTDQTARMNRALAKLRGGDAPAETPTAKPEPAETAAPESEPAETAPGSAETTETADAPAEVPEQRPGESDAKYEARLARAMADLQKKEAESLGYKKQLGEREAAEKQLKADIEALRAQMDKLKDPVEALKHSGMSYDELTKKILAGEIKAPTAEDELARRLDEKSSAVEKQLSELQEKLAAKERAEQEAAERQQMEAQRTRDLETVKSRIQAAADKFPLVSTLSWSADRVLDMCYSEQTQDIEGVMAKLNDAATADVEAILQNPRAIVAMLKRSPKIRETIQAALGGGKDQSRQTPKSSEGPRALGADVVSAPTTPIDRPLTREEKRKKALEILTGGS